MTDESKLPEGPCQRCYGHPNKEEDWIIPGDWIIREAPTEKFDDAKYGGLGIESLFGGGRGREDNAFTDHAVYVIACTRHHLTFYSPIFGHSITRQRDRLPGNWYLATKAQVDETWKLAAANREDNKHMDLEMKAYPYRKPSK